MRKVILSMMVSLDGFTEGKNPEENWHNWNDEMSAYMMDFFQTVDTFIYGRKSYEEMIEYWPVLDNEFGRIMNETPKLVFSRTLHEAAWNSTFIRKDPSEVIPRLKQQDGKNMVIFAGSNLADAFIKSSLVDEYRLIVNPVVLGGRKPLFRNVDSGFHLKLKKTIHFDCGNVLLVYEPKTGSSL